MPNRILKESICTSPELEAISDGAEVMFYRLMVACDDFGIFEATPAVVSSRCFPRRRVPEGRVADRLEELVGAGLIHVYEVEGRIYGQFVKWRKHQRVRATASKHPLPDDGEPRSSAVIRGHLTANVRNSRSSAGSLRKRSRSRNRESKSDSVQDPGVLLTDSVTVSNHVPDQRAQTQVNQTLNPAAVVRELAARKAMP